MMCQMPHSLAMVTMPRSALNCSAMMPSARPAFCMPPDHHGVAVALGDAHREAGDPAKEQPADVVNDHDGERRKQTERESLPLFHNAHYDERQPRCQRKIGQRFVNFGGQFWLLTRDLQP